MPETFLKVWSFSQERTKQTCTKASRQLARVQAENTTGLCFGEERGKETDVDEEMMGDTTGQSPCPGFLSAVVGTVTHSKNIVGRAQRD